MSNFLSVAVNGTVNNPQATATTIGLSTYQIRSIEPFTGKQPLNGVTILTVIKMAKEGTKIASHNYLSATATASVITAAG